MNLFVDIEKKLLNFPLKTQFEVKEQNVGILGPSGSGKSMMLKCIAGIERPDRGLIVLNNTVLFDSKRGINLPPQRRRTGYLFQNYALFPHMNVFQNIVIAAADKKDAERKTRELIESFHLNGLEHSFPAKLSGGEQQRVALARMLASEPEALLLDEPFSALDGFLREQLYQQFPDLLARFRKHYLLVTHDIDEAYRMSEKILIMDHGKKAAFDRKENLMTYPPNLVAARVTGCRNIIKARRVNRNWIEVPDWNCLLECEGEEQVSYVGIRPHHILFTSIKNVKNSIICEILSTVETRFSVTVLFKPRLAAVMTSPIQADIDKSLWRTILAGGVPAFACFPSEKLLPF